MIEIKKILKSNVPSLLLDTTFWQNPFLSISKHRLYAHYKNPLLEESDLVLLLAYLNDNLVGYMGVYLDRICIDGSYQKIGWLSTWWVDPSSKGSGIGRKILEKMYIESNGQIGISQFTSSAKRVYDKSGFFEPLQTNIGIKAVFRSNIAFIITTVFPITNKLKSIFHLMDVFLNTFVNSKLFFQGFFIKNALKNIEIEYLNFIDYDTNQFISKLNNLDLTAKDSAFFEWLKAYQWVQKAPLINLTNKNKYAFSMYAKDFDIFFVKILENGICIGFVVIQEKNNTSKILFTYFDNNAYSNIVTNVIKLHLITQSTREVICYDVAICAELKKSKIFLYKSKKIKESIISKVFKISKLDNFRFNYGDGDCSFA